MAKSLIVKSKKQHIRLWFEFYKLALADKHLKNYIQASSAYYAAWGDVQSFTFDDWWKDHKYLFGASQVEEITKARNFSKQPNVINLTIPLDLPVSNSVKEVKRLVQLKQLQRMVELGIDPDTQKSLKVGLDRYQFTSGVEIRGKVIHEILVVYQYWVELGKPAVNWELIEQIRSKLKSRSKSKWIPMFMIDEDPIDRSNVIRQMRRRIDRGKKICESVSKGSFPGRATLS